MVEFTEFKDCFWGPNGFEELKRYMRIGNEFCKDLASILTERADNEIAYSKGLNRTSLRMQKLSKDFHGGLSDAWLQVSMQFDAEAEMHKAFASTLQEEIVKPLKILAENQAKCRKPIELRVEKVSKNLTDKKADDYKYRSRCFQLVKDIEKYMYSLDEAQKGISGKPPNAKEIQKIEAQIEKTKEQLEKSEVKYHKACSAVELARQDWQLETVKSCCQMQSIESDRISSLEQLIKKLSIQLNLLSKKMLKVVDVYQGIKVDIQNDIKLACKKYGTCANEQELLLYDIYAENTKNMMNKDRRIANLTKWAELFNLDLQAQVKSRQGLEKVKLFTKQNPNFNANNDADVENKLESVQLLQTLYESSLFKVQNSLADLLDNPKPTFNYSNHLITTYDKQGVAFTLLKLSAPKLSISNTTMHDSTSSVHQKATAPSPPLSPLTQSISSINTQSIQGGGESSSTTQTATTTATSSNSSTASSSSSTISSVSPSQSQNSPSSSNSFSSSSFSSLSSTTNLNKSNYLLTTASTLTTSYDRPPSYIAATTSNTTSTNNNNNNNNNTLKRNVNNTNNNSEPKFNIIENHYNNSNQSLSDDENEDEDDWTDNRIIGKCIALYDFKATRDDEIDIYSGDEITIIEKRNDGWWKGKSHNLIGLFPSTYVKEEEV